MSSIVHICLQHTLDAKDILSSLGLDFTYCEQAFSNNSQEEQARVRDFPSSFDYTMVPHSNGHIRPFQKSAIDTHYVYSICPASGRSLRSNISFLLTHGSWPYIFYKFSSDYTFYIIVGAHVGVRWFMYIPELSLSVAPDSKKPPSNAKNINDLIREFNSLTDVYADDVFKHCQTSQSRKTTIITNYSSHIGWAFLSDYAALYYIDNIAQSADKYILLSRGKDFLIQSDYCRNKYRELSLPYGSKELFKFSIDNNLFVLQPSSNHLTKQFCDYIIYKSRLIFQREMSGDLSRVAESLGPKLLINLRTDRRVWLEQKESLAWIIAKLKDKFADLFVVFDGYSAYRNGELSNEASEIVAEQKELALLIAQLSDLDNFVILAGRPFGLKLAVTSYCNIYLVGYGAGMILPYIVGLPGVIHSSAEHAIAGKIELEARSLRELNPIPRVICSSDFGSSSFESNSISSNTDLANTSFYNDNYSIDKEVVLKAIVEIWEEYLQCNIQFAERND